MKAKDAIKEIMRRKGFKNTTLADALGMTPAAVSMRFQQKSITTDKTSEMLRVMGYKLVAVPLDAKDLSEAIRIEEK